LKKEIRVQYSGFIIFSSQIFSIATGLVFTLLLTRNMNTAEFGIWTNIFDYTSYFALFSGILPFWATRFMARNKEGTVRTSTIVQVSIALVSTALYFPAIVMISGAIHTQAYLLVYFVAGLYVFNFYVISIFESLLRSMRPQVIGYGLLIEEAVKVSVAVALIMGLGQLFLGAILGLVVSGLVQTLYYLKLLWSELKQKANWGYLKEWFKGSAVIAYSTIGGQLVAFVFVLLFVFGGSNTRAYYQAAFTFTNIIGYSASLAFALYPKLLSKTCPEEQVGTSFRTVLMLAIPLSTIAMVMSTSFLTILDVEYAVAWPVSIVLTIDALIVLISQFYNLYLMGEEVFDEQGKISLRQLVKSKIFKVFTVTYIQAAVALPLAYYVLTTFPVAGSVQAVVDVVAINIGVHLSTFIGLYWFMRGCVRLPLALKSIGKYVSSSILMGLVLWLLPVPTTLTLTVAKAVLGLAIYVALLLSIDKQARELLNVIIDEIRGTFRQLKSRNNDFQIKYEALASEN
jgi:O-antigen/teichoic acid export membrane protein